MNAGTMKKFMTLVKWEYNGVFLPLCVIIGVMGLVQVLLFYRVLQGAARNVPLSYLIQQANVSVLFVVAFAVLMVLIGVRLLFNFMPSKSMYALLTLPGSREDVYLAKLMAMWLALLVLVAAQGLVLMGLGFLAGQEGLRGGFGMAGRRGADFYLALLEVPFLRMVFPATGFGRALAVVTLGGTVSVVLYVVTAVKSGYVKGPVIAAALWLGLFLILFPFANNPMRMNVFIFVVMVIFTFCVNKFGMKLFDTGEVAG